MHLGRGSIVYVVVLKLIVIALIFSKPFVLGSMGVPFVRRTDSCVAQCRDQITKKKKNYTNKDENKIT